LEHNTSPFTNKTPTKREKTDKTLAVLFIILVSVNASAVIRKQTTRRTPNSSVMRSQTLAKLQNPPPRSSIQGGFNPLNDHQRPPQQRRRRILWHHRFTATRGGSGAITTTRQQQQRRRSAASEGIANPEEEAPGGAQQNLPQRKEEEQRTGAADEADSPVSKNPRG